MPDHRTQCRAYGRRPRVKVLDQMRPWLRDQIGVQGEGIAADRAGYATTQASAYDRSRTGRRMRSFQKGV
ncbi:hypothetical protein [Thermoflexus sp.]|uniref:hypothetical protein n=1 Tax=Thermoflexus sp. TaxID=1969742 RepID=UPI0035E43366